MAVMTSKSDTERGARPWTLLLGPGERLEEASCFLRALHRGAKSDAPPAGSSHLDQLEDLGELFCDFAGPGVLLIDCDCIDLQDVGLVRRFLASRPAWVLELTGEEPGRAAARALRALGCRRWWPAPFELSDLRGLLQQRTEASTEASTDGQAELEAPLAAPEPSAPAGPPDGEPELGELSERDPEDAALIAQVEAILGSPRAARRLPTSEPHRAPAEERGAPEATGPAPSVQVPSAAQSPAPPAPYFKDQVADLADLVQRLELGLARLHEQTLERDGHEARELTRRVDEVTGEVMRLKQFARTLSYLSAPPPPGHQRFALAPMLEELLGARRAEPGSPRYMLRTSSDLPIRSDKALLMQVFDALLYLCHQLAGEDATVRVDGRVEADPTGVADRVLVSIRFPSSDHPDLDPATVLTPYGLRRVLPELGPNALAAAAGILRGQGGSLELISESGAGFEWVLRLPLAS